MHSQSIVPSLSRCPASIKAIGICSVVLIFSCSLARAAVKTLTVAADGSGDFKTVQEALAAVPERGDEHTILQLKAGTYEGPIVVPTSKPLVSFEGLDAEKTIITWNRNVKGKLPEGADRTNPGVHILGDGFHAQNITFQNTSGDAGQGLAVRIDADRVVFESCRFLGWQDTLMANKGRQYFKDCYLEGRVDFIYGDGIAFFDRCQIHSKNGGYVTAASTPPDHAFGFVFLHCKLTGDAVPWVDPASKTPARSWNLPNAQLGRPWRAHASVAFIECEIGDHIKPEGWNDWGKLENQTTARFAEFGNTGPGAQPDKRVAWSKQMTKEEAAKITPAAVLTGSDGWNPKP